MWQALLIKVVLAGLKELAKSTDNKIDDEVVKYVEELTVIKSVL